MNRTYANSGDESEVLDSEKPVTSSRKDAMAENSEKGQVTTEEVFMLVQKLLDDMGFRSTSIERSEDFTERIDGVFSRQATPEKPDLSGYARILTVYRSGNKVHVEFYNFLKIFPSDEYEMAEIEEALYHLFDGNPSVKLEIHE